MKRTTTRTLLSLSVVGAAAIGLLAAGTAFAHPDPHGQSDIRAQLNAPDPIANDDTEGVAFTPGVVNDTDAATGQLNLSITLASPDEGVEPGLAVESKDDRCTVTDAVVECELPELAADTTENFELWLTVTDAEAWKTHPVTTFDGQLSGDATDTAWDSTYTYSSETTPGERLSVDLPESAFPYDAGEPVGGTEVHFNLRNDSGTRLENATLTVEVEGLGEKPTLEIDSTRYRDCDETIDFTMTCEIDFMYNTDYRTFDTRLYSTNTGQEENDSVLKMSVTWTDDDGETHTFAQTRAFAVVFPAEG